MESRNKVGDSESETANSSNVPTPANGLKYPKSEAAFRTGQGRMASTEELSPITAKTLDPDGDGELEFTPSKAYATRKTVAQGALDFALLMANASQMKALVDIPANNRGHFYIGQLLLLALSITLQIAAGLVLLILGMMDPKGDVETKRAERLNNASVCLILLITIVNIFISAFGISYTDETTGN